MIRYVVIREGNFQKEAGQGVTMYAIMVKLQAAKGKEDVLGRLMCETATKVSQNEKDYRLYSSQKH